MNAGGVGVGLAAGIQKLETDESHHLDCGCGADASERRHIATRHKI
jgi:hypothetical protein